MVDPQILSAVGPVTKLALDGVSGTCERDEGMLCQGFVKSIDRAKYWSSESGSRCGATSARRQRERSCPRRGILYPLVIDPRFGSTGPEHLR